MISSLRGSVLTAGADHVVLELGGVGFSVFVPRDVAASCRPGDPLRLYTSLIVREDALTLYGFTDEVDLEVFGHLLSVTGVGPKSALGVLGHLSVDQIAEAVESDDEKPFRRVSGIGPKTAKLIVVQLAGKLPAGGRRRPAPRVSAEDQLVAAVAAALVGLGWSEKVAAEAAAESAQHAEESDRASVAALLRRTLALLGPAQAGGPRG